jgi:hypothetical protein
VEEGLLITGNGTGGWPKGDGPGVSLERIYGEGWVKSLQDFHQDLAGQFTYHKPVFFLFFRRVNMTAQRSKPLTLGGLKQTRDWGCLAIGDLKPRSQCPKCGGRVTTRSPRTATLP